MSDRDRTSKPDDSSRTAGTEGGMQSSPSESAIPDAPAGAHRDQAGHAGSGDDAELQSRAASRSDRAAGSSS